MDARAGRNVGREPDRLADVRKGGDREEVLRKEGGHHLEAHAQREDRRSHVAHPLQMDAMVDLRYDSGVAVSLRFLGQRMLRDSRETLLEVTIDVVQIRWRREEVPGERESLSQARL